MTEITDCSASGTFASRPNMTLFRRGFSFTALFTDATIPLMIIFYDFPAYPAPLTIGGNIVLILSDFAAP